MAALLKKWWMSFSGIFTRCPRRPKLGKTLIFKGMGIRRNKVFEIKAVFYILFYWQHLVSICNIHEWMNEWQKLRYQNSDKLANITSIFSWSEKCADELWPFRKSPDSLKTNHARLNPRGFYSLPCPDQFGSKHNEHTN